MAKRQIKLSALAQLFADNLNAHAKNNGYELDYTTAGQMGTDYDEIQIYNKDVLVRVSVGLGHMDFGDGTTYPSNNKGKIGVYPSFRHAPGGCYSTVQLKGNVELDYSDLRPVDVAPILKMWKAVGERFAAVKALIEEPIC
jgi:hypothetical protein